MPDQSLTPLSDSDRLDQYEQGLNVSDLRQTIMAAPTTPDVMAQQTQTARQLGVAPHQIEGLAPQAQTAVRANNMAAVAQAHPPIAAWAVQNPRQAVAASDDHKSLGILGQAWDWVHDNIGNSLASSIESGEATILHGVAGLTSGARDETQASGFYRGPSPLTGFANDIQQSAQQDAAKVQVHNWATKGAELVGSVVPFAVAGEFAPAAMGASGAGQEVEAAAKANKPVSTTGMVANAAYQATIGHVFGMLGNTVAPLVGDAVAGAAGRSAAKMAGGSLAGNYLGQAASEGAGALANYATRAVGSAGLGAAMQLGSNAIERNTINPNQSYTAGVGDSALSMVALDLLTHSLHAAIGQDAPEEASPQAQDNLTRTASTVLPDAMKAVQGLKDASILDAIDKAASDSTFKKRDPDGYTDLQKFLGQQAGIDTVHVDPAAIRAYQQSDHYDSFNDPFSQHEAAIQDAETSGGKVPLPVEFVTGDLAGTQAFKDIRDHIQIRPDGMTGAEARAMIDELPAKAKETFDRLSEADTAAATERDNRADLVQQITEKVQNAGFTPHIANTYAELIASRVSARADRLGKTMQPGDFDTRIMRILPPSLEAARKADNLDLAINAMREGKPAEKQGGKSLLQFIADRGGINDTGGDLKAMGVDQWHRGMPGRKKLIRDFNPDQGDMLGGASGNGDFGHDTTLRAAIDAGYFPELANVENEHGTSQLDTNDLHTAISDELSGRPRYAEEAKTDPMRAAGEDLRRMIENEGRDPSGMSDKEIRKLVEEVASRPVLGDGRTLEQSKGDNTPRGQIRIPADGWGSGPATIELFHTANLSTLVHELGHQWLEELRLDAEHPDAPDQIKSDWQAVQKWFKDQGHVIGDDGVIPTDAHEVFARGIERYMMEGKAPSKGIAPIFEKIRGWMVNVYKNVLALKSPITPEIREVFDRLIATDDEISAAQNQLSLRPAIRDAKALGMSDAEALAYAKISQGARDEAQSDLLAKTMETVRRQHTAEWNKERAGVRSEEAARLEETPMFTAMRLMKETPVDKQWVKDRFGEDATKLLPSGGSKPMIREGGAHPDDIAEQAGFNSGEEMLKTLIGAERENRDAKAAGDSRSLRNRIIDKAADTEMSRRHGDDPFNDGSIEDEAVSAVNNELAGKLLETELRILGKRSGNLAQLYAVARQWARERVRTGTITAEASAGAIQQHVRAMDKAGRDAEKAIIAGKYDDAFAAKQRQMMASALLREATDARDEVSKAQDALAKIAKRKTMKSVDQDYLDQAHALLDDVQLGPRSQRSIDRQDKWSQWAKDRAAEGYDVVVPDSFEATIKGTHWSRLSVENFLGLKDAVDQVMHLGKLKQTLLDNQEERTWDAIYHEAESGAGNIKGPPPKSMADLNSPGWIDSVKGKIASLDAQLLRMETVFDWLDGGNSEGVFNRIALKPIAEAHAREHEMLKDYLGDLKDLVESVPKDERARWNDREVMPWSDTRTNEPMVLTRQQVLAMALNTGNEGNMQRLLDGYRLNEGAVQDYLNRTLTKSEWGFVQGVWDKIETLWPELSEMERRVNGVAPDKVEPRGFDTPHGSMRGGYYPAVYDSTLDTKAEQRSGSASDLLDAKYTRATTRASATNDRAEQVKAPILLDLGVINRHLSEVIHDITHREAVIQAWKFLGSERVQSAVKSALGPEIAQQFRPWVKSVANSMAMDRAGNEGFGKFLRAARMNVTMVGLGFRATTILVHTSGLAAGASVIGEAAMAHGLSAMARDPVGAVKRVLEASPEVRAHLDHYERDIGTMIDKLDGVDVGKPLNAAQKIVHQGQKFALYGIGWIVQRTAVPVWIGAYDKGLRGGLTDEEAKFAADKAVRYSLGAAGPKDLASIQRGNGKWGEAIKILSMFYTSMASQYQRQRTFARDVVGNDARRPRDPAQLASRAFWGLAMVPLWDAVIKLAIGGSGPDKNEWWSTWLANKFMANMLGPIPLARDLFEPTANAIEGHFSREPSITPMQGIFESVWQTGKDIGAVAHGKPVKNAVKDSLTTAGYLTGLVPQQVAAASQFLVDVGNGSQHPNGFRDWVNGLSSGHVPKH